MQVLGNVSDAGKKGGWMGVGPFLSRVDSDPVSAQLDGPVGGATTRMPVDRVLVSVFSP